MLRLRRMVWLAALAIALLAGASGAAAQIATVDFDTSSAPCGFAPQMRPISDYVPASVVFSGTTMEVVNECGGFHVSGHSSPNLLAWNTAMTTAGATLTFPSPVSNVSIRAGASSGMARASAYDSSGALLGSASIPLTLALARLSLPYPEIARVEIDATASAGVWDDLTYGTGPCGNGVLDPGEACDDRGPGDCCSAECSMEAAGAVCRAVAGVCDVAEFCSGTSGACPSDVVVSAGVSCRAIAGPCDAPEMCTGTSGVCPPDELAPASVSCRAASAECDAPEHCTGTAIECPPDSLLAAGTPCRPAAAVCDLPESCSGASPVCPVDSFAPAGAVCRPPTGPCDGAEICTGIAPSCPPDLFAPTTLVCREGAGGCDVPERCTGTSEACPPDGLAPAGTVCRADGACDGVCSGSSALCTSSALGCGDAGAELPDAGNPPVTSGGCGCSGAGRGVAREGLPLILLCVAALRRRARTSRA